jgi:hypothetical protein
MNRKFWIHLILVVFLGSCQMPSFVGDESPNLASDASALSGEGSGQGSEGDGSAGGGGETCCQRMITMLPVGVHEDQRQGLGSHLSNGFLGSLLTDEEEDCPLVVDIVDLEAYSHLDQWTDEIGSLAGADPDLSALAAQDVLLDFDYLFVGNLTTTEMEENPDDNWIHGEQNMIVNLVDHHHGTVIQTGSVSWKGSPADDEMLSSLSNPFKPLDELLHDYERLPENVDISPDQDPIGTNEEMTIRLTHFKDSQGRQPHDWWNIFVRVDKGEILNGEDQGSYKRFKLETGTVDVKYRSPATCPCDDRTDTIHVFNTCSFKPESVHPGLPEREIANETFEILCDTFELEFAQSLHQSVPGALEQDIFYDGTVKVKIDDQQTPPHLEGKGKLTISGTGVAGDCQLTHSGGGTITVTGTLEEREELPPLLKFLAQMNVENHSIDNSCAEEGGGIVMPVQLQDADIELDYVDGEVYEWEYTQPTVSGSSSWTLQLPCP